MSPNRADGDSTNVESSESDGYEDVMSGDDEDEVVKSEWTIKRQLTPHSAPEV